MHTHCSLMKMSRRSLLLAGSLALAGCAKPPPPPPPAPPPAPAPVDIDVRNRLRFEDTPEGARAILPNSILFEFGKSDLSPDAGPILDLLKPAFTKARGNIVVEGHTDGVGSDAANKKLSLERAERVRAALVDRQVPPNRLEVRGLGKERPRYTPEATDQDRAANRRAEILFPGETVEALGGREIEALSLAVMQAKLQGKRT